MIAGAFMGPRLDQFPLCSRRGLHDDDDDDETATTTTTSATGTLAPLSVRKSESSGLSKPKPPTVCRELVFVLRDSAYFGLAASLAGWMDGRTDGWRLCFGRADSQVVAFWRRLRAARPPIFAY